MHRPQGKDLAFFDPAGSAAAALNFHFGIGPALAGVEYEFSVARFGAVGFDRSGAFHFGASQDSPPGYPGRVGDS